MRRLVLSLALASLSALAACGSAPVQQRAGVLEYLYPAGVQPTPPADVQLALPLRVGVAFAPTTSASGGYSTWTGVSTSAPVLDESEKQRLLERVVDAFEGTEGVQSIQIVPSSYLKPGGGFENVDQLRALLGIDVIALLSFEQTQFQDFNKASLTYWTLVGGYFIEGNENETNTFVDTSVFDIRSRALLFNAGGRSKVQKTSTALEAGEALRADASRGFDQAVSAMITELQVALAAFREQAKTGTVRGAGTPKLEVQGGGGTGAGASGALELALAATLAVALARGALSRRRDRHA